jgi:predicted nucleic acid-binding protein
MNVKPPSVVDASVALKWILPEMDSDKADALFEGWKAEGIEAIAPEFILIEIANTLWKKVERGEISPASGLLKKDLESLVPLSLVQTTDYLAEALKIALEYHLTVYDSLYVAVAARHGILYTADRQIAERVPASVAKVYLL